MLLTIHKSGARRRFDDLCNSKNAEMPLFEVTRTTPKGTQTYQRQKKAISDGAQNTGKTLIMAYAHSFRRSKEIQEEIPQNLKTSDIPSLYTNATKLSNFRQSICSRTIRNHIRELKQIGFITKTKFHGSKHDFEVWFEPKILFGQENADFAANLPNFSDTIAENSAQNPENSNSTNGTNFPHRQAKETYGNITKSTMKVENTSFSWKTSNGNTPKTPQTQPLCQVGGEDGNKGGGGGGDRIVDNFVNNPSENVENSASKWKTPAAGTDFVLLHSFFQASIREFYKYAKLALYPDQDFTEYEFLRFADTVYNSHYREFINQKPSKTQFQEFHSELLKAINVAKKYYDSNPNRYPGYPFSTTQNHTGYFDHLNEKGFNVAKNWRFKNKAVQNEEYGQRLIKTAILHLKNHPKGKAPKHLQIKTYSEVLNFYLLKFKSFSKETQNQFLRRFTTLTHQ